MTANDVRLNINENSTVESLLAEMPTDPRERRALVNAALITLAREYTVDGLVAYCKFVHGWDLEPHHTEWAKFLVDGTRICIVAPPETGKSRLLRAWCEWAIGHRRDRAIMIIANTITQAKKSVWAVGQVITHSPNYKQVFPDVKPTENWARNELYVDRVGLPMEFRPEPTLAGFGVDGAYQGTHVDDLIIDDPTDQQDVNSLPTMLMQREQVTGVLYDRLKDDIDLGDGEMVAGNLFGILTRWADDDLVPTLEQIGMKILSYPAWKGKEEAYSWDTSPWSDEHPVSMLSEKWHTYAKLLDIREKKTHDFFNLTFMCQTEGAVRGVRVFPLLDRTRHYVSMQVEGRQFIKITGRRSGADYGTTVQHQSAMVVITKNKKQQIWVRAAWMSPSGSSIEMGEKAAEWKGKFGVHLMHFDRSQGSLKDMFEQLGYSAFKGEASVELRIGALRTLLEHNLFFVDMDGEGTQKLWSQITAYRYDEFGKPIEIQDDLVDALLYAVFAILETATAGRGPDIEIVAPKRKGWNEYDPEHDDFDPTRETQIIGPDVSRKRRTGMQGYGI